MFHPKDQSHDVSGTMEYNEIKQEERCLLLLFVACHHEWSLALLISSINGSPFPD